MQRRFDAQRTDLMGFRSPLPPAVPPYNPLQRAAGAEDLDRPALRRKGQERVATSNFLDLAPRLSQAIDDPRAPVEVRPRMSTQVPATAEEQAQIDSLSMRQWRAQADELFKRGLISKPQYDEILSRIPRRR